MTPFFLSLTTALLQCRVVHWCLRGKTPRLSSTCPFFTRKSLWVGLVKIQCQHMPYKFGGRIWTVSQICILNLHVQLPSITTHPILINLLQFLPFFLPSSIFKLSPLHSCALIPFNLRRPTLLFSELQPDDFKDVLRFAGCSEVTFFIRIASIHLVK
jgi:hypothetical protein